MEKEERTAEAAGYEGEITAENLWTVIVSLQGKVFYTSKKLPFTYTVRGGEFVYRPQGSFGDEKHV